MADTDAVKEALDNLCSEAHYNGNTLTLVKSWRDTIEEALASRPAEVDDEGLPVLPKEMAWWEDGRMFFQFGEPDGTQNFYTAEQYRQGQRDAVAADRVRRGTIDRPRITEIVSDCMTKHGVQYQPGMGAMIVDLMEEFGAAPSHTTNKEK